MKNQFQSGVRTVVATIAILLCYNSCKTSTGGVTSSTESASAKSGNDTDNQILQNLKTTKLMALFMPNEGVTFFNINLLNQPDISSDNALAFTMCKPDCVSKDPPFSFTTNLNGETKTAILEVGSTRKNFMCMSKTYDTGETAYTCHE